MIVFALNTVVGFACSVGVNMGFNATHHPEDAAKAPVHIHKDGKRHIHQKTKESHHSKEAKHGGMSKSNTGDCCTDQVKEFHDLDKSIPASQTIAHPIFFTAFVAVYFYSSSLPHFDIVKDIGFFVRSYHPPIPNIRLAIQSFQI